MSYLNYILKDGKMSNDTVSEIIYKFIKDHRMKAFVKEVVFDDEKMGSSYDFEDYILYINNKKNDDLFDILGKSFNFSESISYNAFMFYIIMHELRHAFQIKTITCGDSPLSDIYFLDSGIRFDDEADDLLTDAEYDLMINEYNKRINMYYAENHSLSSLEKDACCFGYSNLRRVLLPCKNEYPEALFYATYSLYLSLLVGYDKYASPFVEFVNGREGMDRLNDLEWFSTDFDTCYDNISKLFNVNQRLSLGLPASEDEVLKLYKKIEGLR